MVTHPAELSHTYARVCACVYAYAFVFSKNMTILTMPENQQVSRDLMLTCR